MPQEHAESAAEVKRKPPETLLREVQAALSTVYHDANNPLAIISGNAQYLMELARMTELDEELAQPIRDIEEASRRVALQLRELVRLREQLTAYLEDGEDE